MSEHLIESYTFGKMRINGRDYRSDLTILPDGTVQDEWWRKSGHRLEIDDLADVLKAAPPLLIIGTGMPGLMKPNPTLIEQLNSRGIWVSVMPTAEAVKECNRLTALGTPFAACFHLTC